MNRGRPRELLTSDEKVLIHLLNYLEIMGDDRVPFAITQQGISEATGLQRSHIPRIASRLEGKGYISVSTRYVKGSTRRRKTYTLTQKGAVAAKAIFTSLMDEEVLLVTDDEEVRVRISDLPHVVQGDTSLINLITEIKDGKLVLKNRPFVDFSEEVPVPVHFFGREAEMEEVNRYLADGVRMLFIHGIAGIGKSSFASVLVHRLRVENNIFWYGIKEWDTQASILLRMGEFFSEAGVPMLTSYLRREGTPSLTEVFLVIRDSISRMGPTIMVFDDIHDAGADVQELLHILSLLIGELNDLKLLFLSREPPEEYLTAARNENTNTIAKVMPIKGLDSGAAAEILRERGIEKKLWNKIIENSGGHPLVLELVNTTGGGLKLEDVEGFIRSELISSLSPAEREVLFHIAVFRNGASPSALHMDMEHIESIESLISRGLVVVLDGKYHTHQLVKEFINSRMGGDMKRRLHSLAASYFLSLSIPGSADALEAIYHQIMGGDYRHAAHTISRFGPRIINDGFAEQLLEFMNEVEERDVSAIPAHIERRFLEMKARIYTLMGMYDTALSMYSRVIEISGPKPSPLIFYHMADILYTQGKSEASLQQLKKGLEYISGEDTNTLTRFELLFGRVFLRSGMYEDALRYFNRCLRGFVSEGDMKSMMEVFQNIASVRLDMGEYAKAEEFFRLSLNIARELQDSYMVARAYHNLGVVYHESGRLELSEDYFQRAFEIWKGMGAVRESSWAVFNISEVYIERGLLFEAAVLLDPVEETLSFIGDRRGLSSVWKYRGKMYALQGKTEETAEAFERSLSLLSDLNMPQVEAVVKGEYGIGMLMLGDPRADKLLSEAVDEMMSLGLETQAGKLKERADSIRRSN